MSTNTRSQKIPILIGLAIVIIIGLMAYGILTAGKQESVTLTTKNFDIDTQNEMDTKQFAETQQPAGLLRNVKKLAAPSPEKQTFLSEETPVLLEQTQEQPFIDLVVPAESEHDRILKQEQERIREHRLNLELQALNAPLVVYNVSAADNGGVPVRNSNARIKTLEKEAQRARNGELTPPQQNRQDAFTGSWNNTYKRQAAQKYEIRTGTIIPCSLITGINSQLPGNITAHVTQNVYDTATGQYLMIPQGTKILGKYDNAVTLGQERIYMVWNRLIFPDASTITLQDFKGIDHAGYSGLTDIVDNHYFEIYGKSLLMALISGGTAYAVDKFSNGTITDDGGTTVQSEVGSQVASQIGETSMKILERNLSYVPTLEIRPGFRFNILAIKDIVLEKPYEGWR